METITICSNVYCKNAIIPARLAMHAAAARLLISIISFTKCSLLADALFLLFADGRKETSAMGRKLL